MGDNTISCQLTVGFFKEVGKNYLNGQFRLEINGWTILQEVF